jgi:putative acetyltransferase
VGTIISITTRAWSRNNPDYEFASKQRLESWRGTASTAWIKVPVRHWGHKVSDFEARVGMVGPQTSQNALYSTSPLAHERPLRGDLTRRFAPPEGVQFCPRRSDHAAALFALFNERQFLERASTRGPLADEDEVNRWLDGIVVARKFEIVAVSNSNLIAFGGLYIHGDLFDHCGTLMLGVRENAQGRGVGSTLMAILLATAKMRANLRRVQLTVFAGNARAIRLYRRFGFEFEGLHRCFSRRGTDYVDAFSMAVILDGERRPAGEAFGGEDASDTKAA